MVSVRELLAILDPARTIDVEIGPQQYALKSQYRPEPYAPMVEAVGDYAVDRLTTTEGQNNYYIVVKTQPVRKAVEA